MKKSLLLTLALLLSVSAFAQNRGTLLSESFDGSEIPLGWTVKGGGVKNWEISTTNFAGGQPNELQLFWDPLFNGTTRMTTPSLDLTGISSIVVSFKHYLNFFSNTCILGIATTSDNGETWNTAWTKEYTATGQHVLDVVITTPDMGNPDVKVCIFYEGDTDYINYWMFDDIHIFSQEENDVELTSIDVPAKLGNGNNDIIFSIKNIGTEKIQSFEAKYQLEGSSESVTETFTADLSSFETGQFTFVEPLYLSIGEHKLNIEVTAVNGVNDGFIDNNTNSKDLNVEMGVCQRIPMIEHFSSSTCGPCLFTNIDMDSLTKKNAGKFTYVKYPMNGPGTGDPYYTSDCSVRRIYYNVNSVPMLFLDGEKALDPIPQYKFDESYNALSFVDMRGSFTVEGNTINVIADFFSYVDVDNLKAYISVNEKTTTKNIGTNGESEFHHIMMKLLKSQYGTAVKLEAGKHYSIEVSFDMSTTNVEEMEDLEVALWLQENGTKSIWNSHFAYEYSKHVYPVRNLKVTLEDNSKLNVNWSAPIDNAAIAYNVIFDGELVAENIKELSYTDENQSLNAYDGNSHIIEVVALYEDGKTSVSTVGTIGIPENVNEVKGNSYDIYPNPTDDVMTISGENINAVSIYNSIGALVETIAVKDNETKINTSNYNNGIYIINIISNDGIITTKKFVVSH